VVKLEVVIREARAADVPAILAIYRDAGIEGDEGFTVEEATAHLESFRSYPNYRVFVATLQDEVVGTYSLLIMDNLAKRGLRSGIVEEVGVTPNHQGQGIGRTMMHHAMEECRAAGCYKLALSSNMRRTEAHEFYETLGFERHGYSFSVSL
jgi:GNAT superfamily N-acetyltransferase